MAPEHATLSDSVEAMLARARDATGIDIVDEEALEPLTVFCEAVDRDGKLSSRGAVALDEYLQRSLVNRLRMLRDFRRHPGIRAQSLRPPVIVCGVLRTGSTKTHKLLAASGDFNWLSLWMSLNPALVSGDRGESPQPRIEDTERFIALYDKHSPEMKFIHELGAREPEEESFALVHSLRTPCLTGVVEAPAYLAWLMKGGVAPQFEFLADVLRYLQWQGLADPDKRWLLKSPFYSGLEPMVQKVFPGASLIMTHRHPAVTVPSTCSLFACCRKPYTDAGVDAHAVLAGLAQSLQMHLQHRALMPMDAFLDIHYRSIVAEPEQTVRRIYTHCGVPLSGQALARMLEWNARSPQHRSGRHHYSLEGFGLSAGEVEMAFGDYIRFLDRRFPGQT